MNYYVLCNIYCSLFHTNVDHKFLTRPLFGMSNVRSLYFVLCNSIPVTRCFIAMKIPSLVILTSTVRCAVASIPIWTTYLFPGFHVTVESLFAVFNAIYGTIFIVPIF